MKISTLLLGTFSCLLLSCVKHKKADLIVHNGTIYTCDIAFSSAQAMAIKDGKIIEIGPEHQIRNKYTAENTLDLKKRTIVPTFFDAHSYLFAKVLKRNVIEYDEQVSQSLKKNGQTNYIYNVPEDKIEGADFPGFRFIARSVSGNRIKVDAGTMGMVFKKSFNKTQYITDKDSISELITHFESTDVTNDFRGKMSDSLFKNGYSGCTSFGVRPKSAKKALNNKSPFYHQLVLEGNEGNFLWFTKVGKKDDGNVRLNAISYFVDGSVGSENALLKTSYETSTNNGRLFIDSSAFEEIPSLCASLNIQLIFHSYGDSAFNLATSIMRNALKTVNDNRWRIEHCQLAELQDMSALKKHSILPSIQPTQLLADKIKMDEKIGTGRNCDSYNFNGLYSQNQFIAAGSLYPIDNLNPIKQFGALIKEGECLYPVDRKSALKALTIWPATLAFFENETGSLEIGKNADFVVLNLDLMKASIETLPQTQIEQTYINGELRFRRN